MRNNEKVVFAITCLDPDLSVLRLWKEIVKTTNKSINEANDDQKEELKTFYEKTLQILGSNDDKILHYEFFYSKYLKKLQNKNE